MSVLVSRVLDPQPVETLDAYVASGGGAGLEAALKLGSIGTVDELDAAGLRGRGGAGFPTGAKWRTVAGLAATVLVNGAEGEPGSFKDRTLLVRNPYRVLEGALIAAHTVGADRIVVALKRSFAEQIARLRPAIAEVRDAGWADGVELDIVAGPGEYLFGEETALLEVTEGRPPFPRVTPPYVRGIEDDESTVATEPPPTLANNVETLANVALILANGATWFRELGTAASPGTVVCTVSGSTLRAGVGEVPLGTPLRAVIEEIGGGTAAGTDVQAVLSGVSHPFLPASALDTPADVRGHGGRRQRPRRHGLHRLRRADDLVAVAQGVSRFLAVESCGQCTPCKQDGLAIAELLSAVLQLRRHRP